MKQNGKELKLTDNMDGNKGEIIAKIHSLLEEAGEEELELFLIFLDTYIRKKNRKRADR